MATQVKMPKLGQTMEEGTILTWLKREGERVTQGEPLVQIETDKVVWDVEASASGLLHTIVAREGEKIPVGNPIAVIATEGEVVDLGTILKTRVPAGVGAQPMRAGARAVARTDGASVPEARACF